VGRAQEPQTLFVSFTFRAPGFVTDPGAVLAGNLTAPQKSAMETGITGALVKVLAERFPYWTFQPGRADVVPRLSIWVEKRHPDWEVRMALVGLGGRPLAAWKGRLFAPGDLERFEGLPASETWPDSIRTAS